jgi:hypothetical protein
MEKIFRILEPEVAGGFGDQTVLDYSTIPPTVEKLHYEFGGWLGDDLLTTTTCFIVTVPLMEHLTQFTGTGYTFDEVLVSKSKFFQQRRPEIILPPFFWLKIVGQPGVDDAGLGSKNWLVVSDALLSIFQQHNIANCIVRRRPYQQRST